MRHLPWVIGAIATTVAGVVCGTTVNTTPLTRWDSTSLGEFASHQPEAISPDRYRAMQAPRDRYAISTPDGVVPVEELSSRGLYRNARFANTWYDDGRGSVSRDESQEEPESRWAGAADEAAPNAAEPRPSRADLAFADSRPLDVGRPVQVTSPAPVLSRSGGPRTIEWGASLQSGR